MSVPLPLTVRQGLCASTQLRALVFSVSVLLVLQEMEDTLVMVVVVSNTTKYYTAVIVAGGERYLFEIHC